MLENYLDIITNMENFVDGVLVTDHNADVVYVHEYSPNLTTLTEKDYIGKNLFEIYPDMDPSASTIIRALKTGETTLNYRNILTTVEGDSFEVIDDTFPIRENGKIIGAVCITFSPLRKQAMKALNISTAQAKTPRQLFTEADIIGRSESINTLRRQIRKVAHPRR